MQDPVSTARVESPAPPLRIIVFSVTALVLGVATVWTFAHSGHQTYSGRIVSRTTFVTADRSGVVTELMAHESDRVTLGDPLVSLTDEELQEQIAGAQESVATLTAALKQAEAHANVELAWRLKEIDEDITATQLQAAGFLKEKYNYEMERSMWADVLSSHETVMFDQGDEVFKSVVLRNRLPNDTRMSAVMRMESAANAVDVSAAQVEICDGRLSELRRLKEELPEHIRDMAGVDTAEAELARAQAELERLQEQQVELTVASTSVGTVGVFQLKPGDHLQPGTPIVELLDDSQRWIEVGIPSRDITAFTIGSNADLEFPGGVDRSGRVFSIAPQAEPGNGTRSESDALVMVRIEQTDKLWPTVPVGSRVDVRLAK